MEALVLEKGGSIDGFTIKNIDRPQYNNNELLIKVQATGLNPSDYQTAEYLQGDVQSVLGLDVSGIVEECGKDCTRFKKGDRVFFLREIMNPYGGFGEYAVTPEKFAVKIPDEVSFVEAATLPGAGFTAYHIMEQRFHLHSGKIIFIQGGAGVVGGYAIQLAKLHGLTVITTCLERDINYVKELGADYAIDFQHEDVYARISEITDGVDYALSTIGPAGATKDLALLRFNGELVVTSGLPDFSDWNFYQKGITVHEIAFGQFLSIPDSYLNSIPAQIGKDLASLVASKQIVTPKTISISLSETPQYLKELKAGNITGKVVINMTK